MHSVYDLAAPDSGSGSSSRHPRMTREHYAARHGRHQPEAKAVSFVGKPEARENWHEGCPNLWLVWNFPLRRSSQLADSSSRDCQRRVDWYASLAHHRPWARRTNRCLSSGHVGWASRLCESMRPVYPARHHRLALRCTRSTVSSCFRGGVALIRRSSPWLRVALSGLRTMRPCRARRGLLIR